MTVFFVLPAFNEEKCLPLVLQDFHRDVQGSFSVRIIVVDDGSTDNTRTIATPMPVEWIVHPSNRGLGQTIRDGLHAAAQQAEPSDIIVTMDADHTHPASAIPAMIGLIQQGYDLVIASRYREGSRVVGLGVLRRLMTLGARVLFQARFPIAGVRDYTCGFRAYRASIVQAAFDRWGDSLVSERSFLCMAEILVKVAGLGIRIVEVPFVLRYDLKEGASKAPLAATIWRTLRMLVRGQAR